HPRARSQSRWRCAAAPADEHPTCSLGTSIAQFLHLLLHTRPGQLRSATDFGCALWDVEFDNAVDIVRWEETLSRSLLAAIEEHEPRLRDVRVRVAIKLLPPAQGKLGQAVARRQADISVQGVVRLTHETFSYATQLHIGQLAA
ncbi:MAG: hypothetical protein EOO59_19135, partial [Hymenobacter sp.]